MNFDRFWQIIKEATNHDPKYSEDWDDWLLEQLVKLSPNDILMWDRIFEDFMDRAYRRDLWAAAYLIN